MSNIAFELFAKLGLDSSEYEKGLNNAKGIAGTIGSGIKTAFGIGAKAIGAATAAVGAFGLASVKGYAEYEQLVGGVSKLYGTAGQEIEEFAESQGKTVDEVREKYNQLKEAERLMAQQSSEAYKTAGMSANEYMETATSFSAALINSLSGNTVEAAKMTDVAMRAISDNVNTFGSSMESVSDAFKGFSKMNFTMLDNLKLGYGGTKSEMLRLIADANEYRASIGETADLSIDSFADIVQAIQSVQEAQHIAGTTNKEAMSTIEGSAAATKAAWQNVITAIAGGGDLKAAFDGLVSSIFGEKEGEGFLSQIIPRIETTMDGIGTFIENSAPYIVEKLPALLDSILPSALQGGVQLIGAIGQGIINSIPTLASAAAQIVVTLVQGLIEAIPDLANGAITLITALGQALYDNSGALLDSGAELLSFINDGIKNNLVNLVESGGEIIGNLVNGFLEKLPDMIEAGGSMIVSMIDFFMQNFPKFMETGVNLIINIVNGIVNNIPQIVTSALKVVTMFIQTLTQNYPQFLQQGITLLGKLAAGLIQAIPKLVAAIPQIIVAIVKTFTQFDWPSIGRNILEGVKNGIISAVSSVIDAVKDAAGAIWDSITGFFDIHSPSRKMAWIGEMIDKGLAKGINDNDDVVDDAVNKITDIGAISTEASLNLSGGNGANNSTSVIINVYGAVGQDVNELADIVSRRINDVTNRRMMAMGAAT